MRHWKPRDRSSRLTADRRTRRRAASGFSNPRSGRFRISRIIGDLSVGAERVLNDEGRPDLAAQVKHLFTTKDPGDADVIGAVEFERNLAQARLADLENFAKNPHAPPVEVEDAFAETMRAYYIDLPDSFYTVASSFHPKPPPK